MVRYLCWLGLALLAAVLSGCAPPERVAPLKIGMSPWPGYELLHVAEAHGFLRAEGVDIQLVDYPSLGDTREAFERGQLDGFASSLVEVLHARHTVEREPVIALVVDYSNGPDVLLARNAVRTVADLRGRKVGVELETVSLFLLARALQQAGISMEELEVVPLTQGQMQASLLRGDVDAVVTYPPVSFAIDHLAGFHTLFSSGDMPRELLDVVSVERSVFEARRDEIEGLRRAWHRAVSFYRADPQAAIATIAARERASPADVARALKGVELIDGLQQAAFLGTAARGDAPAVSPVGALLQRQERTMADAGLLHREVRSVCCIEHVRAPPATHVSQP